MPSTFLTGHEREFYEQIPLLEEEALRQYFHATRADKQFINLFYGKTNQLSILIQLCLIRFLGHLPQNWEYQVNEDIIGFSTKQIFGNTIEHFSLDGYSKWGRTRTEHLQQILKHLNFRKWQPIDEPITEQWLIQRGLERDNERHLLEILCQKLHQEKILRPAIGALERIVGGIKDRLHEETYERLDGLLRNGLFEKLDNLLEIDPIRKITHHRWLCSEPTASTARVINQTLEKVAFLKELKVNTWDLSVIPANRRKQLASIVRNNTNGYLQRMKPVRRYPLLVCFLWETLLDTTDIILSMYDDYWEKNINGAKKSWELYKLGLVKTQHQALQVLTQTAKMVIDNRIESARLRETIFKNLPKEKVENAIDVILKTNKPLYQTYIYFLLSSYAKFKNFTPNLLKTLDFEVAFGKDNFRSGLDLVINLQTGQKRKLSPDAPTNFVKQSWLNLLVNNNSIETQPYELCVLSVLRDRLLSGDVFVGLSRKFADFNSFLIPKERWGQDAETICLNLNGLDITGRIDQRITQLTSLLQPLAQRLEEAKDIRLENGVLVVPPLTAEDIPESAKVLREEINQRLPKISIVDIIQEVDSWVNYSNVLDFEVTTSNHAAHSLAYAALFGNACNLSLSDLARSSDLAYDSLWWAAKNYFSDENLKSANDLLVNFHHKQWLAAYWGDGTLSSSDGQRYATSGKIRNAKALPKYFAYGQGITFYNYTSDQYSQYGTKVISATERDATYVLDEILANETDLKITEHTTDTNGYSDLVFALFDLVGIEFAPRIRDIKDQRLYKIKSSESSDKTLAYPSLKFTGWVNADYLKKHADELRRVAASLQTGTVTPSLLISKLQAYPRQNNLMYVLQAYGQLNKTIFICNYLLKPALRKKVNSQLNKGEQLHGLRQYLRFIGDGVIRRKQQDEQQITARCLNLLTNIILVWNTVYIQEVIKQLKTEGYSINEADYGFISPAPFEHINRLGKYNFKDEIKVIENGLRELRKPKR
jgi:TnpA family transposase